MHLPAVFASRSARPSLCPVVSVGYNSLSALFSFSIWGQLTRSLHTGACFSHRWPSGECLCRYCVKHWHVSSFGTDWGNMMTSSSMESATFLTYQIALSVILCDILTLMFHNGDTTYTLRLTEGQGNQLHWWGTSAHYVLLHVGQPLFLF